MTTKATTRSRKRTTRAKIDQAKLQAWLTSLRDPAVEAYIADLERRYGRPTISIDELRRLVDEEMGDTTLSDLLFQMRNEA